MTSTQRAVLLLATAFASAGLVLLVRTVANRLALLDHPNARSSHDVPKPRLGGIGVVVAFLAAAAALVARGVAPRSAVAVLLATAGIAAVGLVDDLRSLSARWRFALQIAAAVTVVALRWSDVPKAAGAAGALLPTWVLGVAFVLWIVWLTNLYNFMDGIDGLAGGQAVFAGVGVALVAFSMGSHGTAWIALALSAAAIGFLRFNFPPSTIFMGDVGSTTIGFFLGCIPLIGEPSPVTAGTVAVVLSLFVLDATTTLLRRVARGERWYVPHRSHLYQRPVALGVPHRAITSWAYAGMIVVACAAVAQGPARGVHAVPWFAVPIIVFGIATLAVRAAERRLGPADGEAGGSAAAETEPARREVA